MSETVLTPREVADWLLGVSLPATRPLAVDIGPDHTLLVVDSEGNLVAELDVVGKP